MTNLAKFMDNLETVFADEIEIIIERGETNPYYGTLEIKEGGETVVGFWFEEDKYGEGDQWDETNLIVNFVDSSQISTELFEYLIEHPLATDVKIKYIEDMKLKFMQKGWHVK